MVYCTKCGTPNPEGTQMCIKCNTRLLVLRRVPPSPVEVLPPTSNLQQTPIPEPNPSTTPVASGFNSIIAAWWRHLGPDWKAALVFWIGFMILLGIKMITGGTGNIVTAPFTIIFSLGQGVLAAKLATKSSRYSKADYVRLGLLSGLWTILIDIVNFLVFFAVMFGVSFGAILAALPVLILSQLAADILTIALTGLGAWLYSRYSGKQLVVAWSGRAVVV